MDDQTYFIMSICLNFVVYLFWFYDEFASITRYQISTLYFMRKLFRELSFKYLPPNINQHTICYQFPRKYLRETAQISLVSGQKVPSYHNFMKYVVATTFQFFVVLPTVHLCYNFHQSTHKLFLLISVAIVCNKRFLISFEIYLKLHKYCLVV